MAWDILHIADLAVRDFNIANDFPHILDTIWYVLSFGKQFQLTKEVLTF